MVQVDGPLGESGGPRAVEPEGHVVLVRVGRFEHRGGPLHQRVEAKLPVRFALHHDHVLQVPEPIANGSDAVHQRGVHDQHPGPAVVEQVLVVLAGQQGVHGDGHGADLDRPEEDVGPLRAVGQQKGHPLFHAHAQLQQHVAEAIDRLVQLGVGDRLRPQRMAGFAARPWAR